MACLLCEMSSRLFKPLHAVWGDRSGFDLGILFNNVASRCNISGVSHNSDEDAVAHSTVPYPTVCSQRPCAFGLIVFSDIMSIM